jgi:hypothetical protein
MERLECNEDISLNQVLLENEGIIINATFDAIHKNYFKIELESVPVIIISICCIDFKIRIFRNSYLESLKEIINYFEKTEEYEKCSLATKIIKRIHHIENLY